MLVFKTEVSLNKSRGEGQKPPNFVFEKICIIEAQPSCYNGSQKSVIQEPFRKSSLKLKLL